MSERHTRDPDQPLLLEVQLRDDEEAWQLAQYVKRVTFSDIRARATSDDEAYVMLAGIDAIRRALAEKGFAPR